MKDKDKLEKLISYLVGVGIGYIIKDNPQETNIFGIVYALIIGLLFVFIILPSVLSDSTSK